MRHWFWKLEHRKFLELMRIGIATILDDGLTVFGKKTLRYLLRLRSARHLAVGDANERDRVLAWVRSHKIPVSIIVPSYGHPELTQRCVASLHECGADEIIVVDDGSPAENQRMLERLPCRVVRLPVNRGFANAAIAGVDAARKRNDVVILNSDTEAHPHWLAHLQFCAYRDPRIGIVGPKLVYPNGSIQSAGSFRNTDAPEWFDHYFRYQEPSYPPANVARDVLAVTGAAMYLKRSLLHTIGMFDQRFPMAFEDVDYCLRAWQAGFHVVYCPQAVLTHAESASRGRIQGPREVQSQNHFWERWGRSLNTRPVALEKSRGLRIVYVLQKTNIAGGHRDVFEQMNWLREQGHQVSLYTLEGKPRWFDVHVPVTSFLSYGQLVRALARLPALKVATWWETAHPVWTASLHAGIPVYYVQDVETSYYDVSDHAPRAEVLASYRKEFHYLTISRWIQETLRGFGMNSALIPPWYAHTVFHADLNVRRRQDVVLAVGRSHPLKNFSMTVRGWQAMTPRPRLWLFGTEPTVADGLEARYTTEPSDRAVADLYRQATVFVQTSRHEGFGLPMLEAMACGCPVVCTKADGNGDFCRDGENCLLVPQNDHTALARTLEGLFRDVPLQERLRQGGYETAAQYTKARVAPSLELFYQRLAEAYGNSLAPGVS